jgi:hypothetical protein
MRQSSFHALVLKASDDGVKLSILLFPLLFPSSSILKNTEIRKLDWLLSSCERVGDICSVESLRMSGLEILADLHVLDTPEYEKVGFRMLSACVPR